MGASHAPLRRATRLGDVELAPIFYERLRTMRMRQPLFWGGPHGTMVLGPTARVTADVGSKPEDRADREDVGALFYAAAVDGVVGAKLLLVRFRADPEVDAALRRARTCLERAIAVVVEAHAVMTLVAD
jgi:hypothetical protein